MIELNYNTEEGNKAVDQLLEKLAQTETKKILFFDDFQFNV